MTHANGFATAELLDRKPPADPAAELMVLRACVLDENLMDSADLTADHFHEERHRQIFAAWATLRENNLPRDTRHLAQQLKADGNLDAIGGLPALVDMLAGEALPARTADYMAAVRDAHARRQVLRGAIETIKAVYGTRPTPEVLSGARERLDEIADSGEQGIDYGGMTCAQLFDSVDDTRYLIPGILAAEQPCMVAAPSKSLKTLTMLDLAVSLATASPLFGSVEVPEPIRTAMMSGESGKADTRRNLVTICAARGLTMRDVEGLIIAPNLPMFGSIEHATAVRRFIRQHRSQVLIIDPAYLCMPAADAGNLFAQGALLRGMNDICADEGCLLAIVHHTKRNGPEEFAVPELADIAWSGFAEWARQWILLRRRERYEVGSGVHRLWFNAGGSAGHQFLRALDIDEGTPGNRRWEVSLSHAEDARQAERSQAEEMRERAKAEKCQRDREKLVRAAERVPSGQTISVLRDAAGLATAACRAALSQALERGELVPCEIEKNGRQEKAFRVPQ